MAIAPHSPLMSVPSPVRSLLSVALPVAITVAFVGLALVNIASVRAWRGEPEDGVLWQQAPNGTLVARAVARGTAADRAGVHPGDRSEERRVGKESRSRRPAERRRKAEMSSSRRGV